MLGPEPEWKETDMVLLQEARAEGLTYKQIGEKFGISDQIAFARLAKMKPPRHKNVRMIRQYENRWDLIESYGKTLSEASEAAATPVDVTVR